MNSKNDPKSCREWELEDMDHPDAAIRVVLLIALEKYESQGEPIILTTDEVNEEVVRRGLRDPKSLQGKKKGSLVGAYAKRETLSNLSPPLLIPMAKGTYQFNGYYLDKLAQFGERWRFGEATPVSPQISRVLRTQRLLESLRREVDKLSAKLDGVAEQVGSLLTEETQKISFVHTSPDFHHSTYGTKVTSIKDTVEAMLQRAEHSIKISTRQMDMFTDELIASKRRNPSLDITVLSRGPEGAAGDRRKLAGVAFERMKQAGIKLPIEKDALHSRMVLIDDQEVLVSSADLDFTQMDLEFNAGIWTNNPDVITEAIRYFDNLLQLPSVIIR